MKMVKEGNPMKHRDIAQKGTMFITNKFLNMLVLEWRLLNACYQYSITRHYGQS
jgi:hypothetical protein